MLAGMRLLSGLAVGLILSACGAATTGDDPSSPLATVIPDFTLQCDLSVPYAAAIEPLVSRVTTGTAKATVIALHGKNGSPTRTSHMQTLATGLNAQGYDVIRPQMPWHDTNWDGSLCDGMAYLNTLVAAEKAGNRPVIILGHSLAGPVVLSYSALADTTKADAVVVLAPGHYANLSPVLAEYHKASITLAKEMVAAGNGDDIATFQTYNGGLIDISTTANIYLSFHDPEQYPNVKSSLVKVAEPLLWLAGQDDPLTGITADTFGIIELIPGNGVNRYKVVAGDHFSVVNAVPDELDDWYPNI